MARKSDHDGLRLDEAARAGWLYYVAGNTQDEIARKLGISRQAAQRLVSLAISERLIKVRLDHPIARCMELAAALKLRYDLRFCEVAPSDPASTSSTLGIAQVAAAEFERWLRRPSPRSSASARAARCAPSPINCRRWSARNTSWSRWSAPPRPTVRLRSTTSSFACPTACARRTTRCRCRSSPARSRSANS